MDPIGGADNCWEFLDYNYFNKIDSSDFLFFNEDHPSYRGYCNNIDFSAGVVGGGGGGGAGLNGNVDFETFSGVGLNMENGNESARKSGCSGNIDAGNVDVSFTGGGQSLSDGGGGGGGCSSLSLNQENDCGRKRVRTEECSRRGAKACREKMRREKLNDRFSDLSSILEPGRPVRSDKPALLDDTIKLVNHLRNEAQELKETNEKLLEEIKSLKAEKSELREEKLVLKADKEKMELQLKAMTVLPPGFMQPHPAAYHAGPNKMAVLPPGFMQPHPGYGMIPMWQYLPPATRDTSCDHELRPPAA